MVLQLTKDCKRFYSIAGMNFKGISTLLITSWIVHAIVHKETYGLNTFTATSEEATNKNDWYWAESKNNIADWLTHGKRPVDIDINSGWQAGRTWLSQTTSKQVADNYDTYNSTKTTRNYLSIYRYCEQYWTRHTGKANQHW